VTQPLNAISPIDQKFFELIVPIATFLTGTLSGIMLSGGDKDAQKEALKAANAGWNKPPAPTPAPSSPSPSPMGGMPRPAMPMGMGMGMAPASPLANATTMPVYEAGDPTFRNSRND